MAAELTDEERELLLQKKVLADQEKEKRTAIATKFLKEKLAQEEKNARISMMKINAQWRQIMREAKADEVRKELEILSQVFERVLDRKESVIQSFLRDLAEAEQQEQMTTRSHIANIDKLINFHQEVVEQLHGGFKEELEELRQEFMAERRLILEQHEREMTDIKDIVYALQMLYEDRAQVNENEFNSRRDEMRTKNLDARTTLKASLESKHKEVWDTFEQAMKQYESSTADKRQEFERLRDRDRKAAEHIERNMKRLQQLQERISAYKQRLQQNAKGTLGTNSELRREKEAIRKQVYQLKAHMKRSNERDKRALVTIAAQGKECQQKLQAKLDKAKKVLSLAEVCSKMETEEEKVLPFYKETVTTEEAETELANHNAQQQQQQQQGQGREEVGKGVEKHEERREALRTQTLDEVVEEEQEEATEKAQERAAEEHEAKRAPAKGTVEDRPTDQEQEQEEVQGPSTVEDARWEAHEELPGPTELHAVAYDLSNRRVNTYDALQNFWKRYNKVLLDRLAFEREVSQLEEENTELRGLLKQYLDGISVNEEVLDSHNTLLVVNNRTTAPLRHVPVGESRVRGAHPNVVEASEVSRTYNRMGAQ